MSYKALLFDLDNTLIDFTRSEELSLNTIHNNFFQEVVRFDSFKNHYHDVNKKLWAQVECGQLNTAFVKVERFRLLVALLKSQVDHEEVQSCYEASLVDHASWYFGVKETLTELKKQYRLGIVTNGLGYVQQAKFSTLGVHQLCECMIVSELIGHAKPGKEIFNIALKQLGLLPQDVLMIGDSISSDYLGAINAGLDFCWVKQHTAELPAGLLAPKYVVDSVNQLPNKIIS